MTLYEGSSSINDVFAESIQDASSSDQVEFQSVEDVPSFSDTKGLILEMDLSPYNGVHLSRQYWGIKVRVLRGESQGWNSVLVLLCIDPLHHKTALLLDWLGMEGPWEFLN